MRIRLQIVLLIIPVLCNAQSLIKCNDSTSFLINQSDNSYFLIKLTGKIAETGDSRVISVNNYALQTLLENKNKYISNGNEDIPILSNYIISETKYFTGIFKERLDLMMIPIEISKNKKAVLWYFDIPKKIQLKVQPGETPAIRQVSISVVLENFVYSIGTTQFKDQSFDELQKFLSKLINTLIYRGEKPNQNFLCNEFKY